MMQISLTGVLFMQAVSSTPASIPPIKIEQTPAHLTLADELVEAMQVNRQQMALVPQLVEMVLPLVIRGNEAHADQLRAILRDEYSKMFASRQQDMVRATRDAFARNLNDDDLKTVTAFYRSTAGRHLVEVQPTITAESMREGEEIGRRAAMDAMPFILERMRKANLKVPTRA